MLIQEHVVGYLVKSRSPLPINKTVNVISPSTTCSRINNGWMDGRTDGRMTNNDGWIDGWMDR